VPSTNKIYLRQIPSFMYQSRTWASAVLLDDLSWLSQILYLTTAPDYRFLNELDLS